MTRPVKFVLALLQISCGGAETAAGLAAGDADPQGGSLDSAIPVCLTALVLAMGGCSDGGADNLSADAGDGGKMAATELRDGGQQQMMDSQTMGSDAGATVNPPDAKIDTQAGNPQTGDAMPADSNPQNMPDPMSVMARLKGVPRHVAFVVMYKDQNALKGPRVQVSALKIPAFNNPGRFCVSQPFASHGLYEQQGPRWFGLGSRSIPFETKTILLNKEIESLGVPKTTIVNVHGSFVAMSLEDWIAANIDNLDAAIAAVVPDPDGCP